MDGASDPSSSHHAPEAASDRTSGRSPAGNGHTAPADALRDAMHHLAQLREYAGHFLSAKIDGLKLSLRRAVIYAILGVVGLLTGGAIVITAAVMLLMGLANAIGAIFEPDKPWVGQLIVSVLVLATVVVGTIMLVRKMTGASRARTVARYDRKHDEQRRRFGQDVAAASESV